MKRLLAIAPYPYLPVFSGGQKFIAGFFEHLARQTNLTVISTRNNDPSLAKGYSLRPLLRTSFSRYADFTLTRLITQEIENGGYDAIIWEHPYYGWLAKKVKARTGIRTILHTHNIEHRRFRDLGKWWWPVLRHYEKRAFKTADRILFITEDDRQFAIEKWNIPAEKCIDVPFGIEQDSTPADRRECRDRLASDYDLREGEALLLFNGLLHYKPNLDALRMILEKILPELKRRNFKFRLVVCGRGLPKEFQDTVAFRSPGVHYAGFVEKIGDYFKAADVFLNPVLSGGGVKTKMVEAIGFGTTVVSTRTGATGMDPDLCGDKLQIVDDNDWNGFAEAVIRSAGHSSLTPQAYYRHFNWDNIISRVLPDL